MIGRGLAAVSLLALASACTGTDPLYCDEARACADPARPFCDLQGSYAASGQVARTCIPLPFDGGVIPDAARCDDSSSCPRQAPVCASLSCRPCGADAECAVIDPVYGVCSADGRCVMCGASLACLEPTAPICDPDGDCAACEPGNRGDADCAARDPATPRCSPAGPCVECLADADCSSGLCDRAASACVSDASIVYLAQDGTDSSACGRASNPCATLGATDGALAKVTAARPFVLVRPGIYEEVVQIDALSVTIVGAGATLGARLTDTDRPVLGVARGANVTVKGLTITSGRGGTGHGVECANTGTVLTLDSVEIRDNAGFGLSTSACAASVSSATFTNNAGGGITASGGSITVTQSSVSQNAGGGITTSGGSISVTQSSVSQNAGGGILVNDASAVLENNVVAANGTAGVGGTDVGGVTLTLNADDTAVMRFNTIVGNLARPTGRASGIACSAPVPVTGSSNIVYAGIGGLQTVSGDCNHEYSNIEGGATGSHNLDADPRFVDDVAGDYHLRSGSPCIDAADPETGVATDLDGDRRPAGDGYDIGADEVTP